VLRQAFVKQLQLEGFAICDDVLDEQHVSNLIQQISNHRVSANTSERGGKAFGIRDLLTSIPLVRDLASSTPIESLIRLGLSDGSKVVRGVYLDKHKDANWKVAWHQDLTVAVRERKQVENYGPWSVKAGINHVQPPVSVLQNMLAVRIHLDRADQDNGALRVLPGSHREGRLSHDQIKAWRQKGEPITCEVSRGGVMLMRPLLLHASSSAVEPRHRRVIHLEFATGDLDGGLQWYE